MRAQRRARFGRNFTRSSVWLVVVLAAYGCDKKTAEPAATAVASQSVAQPAPQRSEPATRDETGARSAASAAPQAAAAAGDPCEVVCQRSNELSCNKREGCPALCKEMLLEDTCKAELLRALACFVKEPAKNWECGEDGLASIREGFCDAPQEQFLDCVTEATGKP